MTQSRRTRGRVRVVNRVVVAGRLGEGGEEGDLGQSELVERGVEVVERRRRHAVGTVAEVDLVQIKLEDAVLVIERALDADRQDRLLDLPFEGDLVGQEKVLRHLLGDRRATHRPSVLVAKAPEVGEPGPQDPHRVHPEVAVEVLVLGREEGVDQAVWAWLRRGRRRAFVWRTRPAACRLRRERGSPSAARSL